jgi:hypothetical protein
MKERITAHLSDKRFAAVKQRMDDALPVVLLLLTLLIIFQFVVPVTPKLQTWIHMAGWGVAVFFAARLAVDYRLSGPDENFWRNHWSDLLMAIPLFTLLQEARLAKLMEEVVGVSRIQNEIAAMSTLKNSRTAAKLTKIIHILRRSI